MIQRDKVSLDIFWLKDDSLEDSENLPDPDILAREITENLESALEQFSSIKEEFERGFVKISEIRGRKMSPLITRIDTKKI